jgi:pilus assembly protein CpaE
VSRKDHNSGYGTLAIFTVCADIELSSIATSAPSYIAGVNFVGEFQDYITANRRPHFPPSAKQADSCVAFIDFDPDAEQAIETVEALRASHSPPIISVGVASTADANILLRAMRAGCSEFIEKPVKVAQFHETLQQIQKRLLASVVPPGKRGQVVVFLGAKGGVGTTTLAVHVAASLASKHGKKALLIDHHHQLGHICLSLGIKESQYHFDELIRNVQRLDSDLLKGFIIRHGSGLDVLASPDSCAAPHSSSREELEHVLDFLREEYEFILIDSSIDYDEIAGTLVHLADEVALVSTPDVAALRDLSRHVDHLKLDEIADAKLRIIINRCSTNDGITLEQIGKAVRLPISLTIPNNYAELLRALNQGELLSLKKRSEFTTQIGKWTNRLARVGEDTDGSAAKKKFGFWK